MFDELRIHIGKKHSQIKLQRLQKVQIYTFRGEYRPFLRSVTAFWRTKIGAQILLDQLKI